MNEIEQLKAENTRLKEEIDFLKKELECSTKLRKQMQNDLLKSDRINDNLEVENKRLKQQLAEIGKSWDEIQRLRRENEIITGMHNSSSNRFDKIYQTLQEIREIAEKVMLTELCNSCDGCGLIYGCNDTACAYYQMEKILQIITKAEEE